ncbi:hypothetical protein MUK42_31347 [Musa troglodytarum]|uniref:Uncharacterized protein n=1 Tax=Musa troglodytarum TaxID=320322 RepID=A0A9E7FKG0_9LILI|nr:hypothetical protein MUK42_31347 [Musa troglodytarum]
MAASKSMLLFLLVVLVVSHAQTPGSHPSKRISIINTITYLGRRLPLAPPSPMMAPPRQFDLPPLLLPLPASLPGSSSAAPPPPPPPY